MNEAKPPVSDALVFLCEKCGRRWAAAHPSQDPQAPNVSRQIQQRVKAAIARSGDKGRFRAAVSTCMNLCPEAGITACFIKTAAGRKGGAVSFYVLDPSHPDAAAQEVLSRLRSAS